MKAGPTLTVITCALSLAACGDGRAPASLEDTNVPESERYGGTMVAVATGDFPDINPLTSIDQAAENLQRFALFTPLIYFDERMEPVPGLARSWNVSSDSTELVFHLRDDIYFHDGVKSTAWDVKFFYDRARDPRSGYPNTNFFKYYGEASVPDSFTFRVQMTPHVDHMDFWRRGYALPRHILEVVPPEELGRHEFGTRAPVGNGPFRFAGRVPGQSWTFEANPHHPAGLGGRPYLDRIVYRAVPEMNTAVTELLTGRADFFAGLAPDQARRVREVDQTRLISYPGRANIILQWNQQRPLFRDRTVRRALTHAIDRPAIIDGILHGYGQLANTTVPPFHWAHDAGAGSDLGFDPEGARTLLHGAGWQDRGDGVLRNEAGEPFRFTIKTNLGNQTRKDIAEVIQASLGRLGIEAQIQLVEWSRLLEEIDHPRRDFDALIIGWVTEFRVDDTNLFHCAHRHQPFQRSGYCNPAVDRLLDTLQLVTERQAARPLWAEYQRLIAEDQPYTFLYFAENLVGTSRRLQGVDPDVRGDWVDVSRWWIHPSAR
jgi:peptide/nickel transport system substrate-binding protein